MKDLEREIYKYMKARNWHKLRPSDLAKSVSIEAGELLEIFQWVDLTVRETKSDKEKMRKIKYEIADIFIYCIAMCLELGIDTKKAVREKLAIVDKKYPAALIRKHVDRKRPGNEKIYLKLKEEYRRREGR